MKITLVPKRKLAQSEVESVLLARALAYLAEVTESKLGLLDTDTATALTTHIADTTTHGTTGAVVGTSDTQTLTNKTLTAPTITSGSSIVGAGTGSNGFVLKNLKNSSASALSGTQKDIEIDIGGTPYYFTVYPTKA